MKFTADNVVITIKPSYMSYPVIYEAVDVNERWQSNKRTKLVEIIGYPVARGFLPLAIDDVSRPARIYPIRVTQRATGRCIITVKCESFKIDTSELASVEIARLELAGLNYMIRHYHGESSGRRELVERRRGVLAVIRSYVTVLDGDGRERLKLD